MRCSARKLATASALTCLLALSACAEAPRLDGRSVAAFEESHARMLGALSQDDQLCLLLAEGIVLAPLNCLTVNPFPDYPRSVPAWMDNPP